MQPSFINVGQTNVEWQTFEIPKNKRYMYDSKAWVDMCLSFVCHSAGFWSTALKTARIANFDRLCLVMEFISSFDEFKFMLLTSRHFCIHVLRSIGVQDTYN